jgi:hypothetical protein
MANIIWTYRSWISDFHHLLDVWEQVEPENLMRQEMKIAALGSSVSLVQKWGDEGPQHFRELSLKSVEFHQLFGPPIMR